MKTYDKYVIPYSKNFIKIYIDDKKIKEIETFVEKLILEKRNELHHKIDCFNERKRFVTGFMGEAAMEILLKVEIIDYSIGNSIIYHSSDLKQCGYDVGIKTVEYGKFPVIFKKPERSEIFLIKKGKNDLYVCGLATVELLKIFQDDELILSPLLKKRGTKTCYYNFKDLLRVKSINDLSNYRINKNKYTKH